MPTVHLNKEVFESLVGKKLSLEELKNRISMIGTDLESIQDNTITVEIFPNRPDMLSEQGFARAFSSFIGEKRGLRKYEVKKSGEKVIVDKSTKMRPYMVGAIVKNITFNDERIREIMQVQEKLSTTHGRNRKKSEYGFFPLENVHFPLQYVAHDPSKIKFKPLGFDEEMVATKVEEVHPKGIAYKWLAEEWKKEGHMKYPFLLDNKKSVMAMYPYTNSNDTGKVDQSTNGVFVEATGVDLSNVNLALNILTTMLADMGGEIYSIDMVYPDKTITTPNLEPERMKLDLAYINKHLGLNLNEKEVKELLEKMGYGYENGNVFIPAYRGDVLHQADLAEDIAIAYGYENFKEEIPNVATVGKESDFEKFKTKIAQILVGLNLIETNTYHLTNKDKQNVKTKANYEVVELANALTQDYNVMRAWLVPDLLEVLQHNKHNEYPQNIFLMGSTFKKDQKTETGTAEESKLCVMNSHEQVDYTQIKQMLDYLMRMLDVSYDMKEAEHPSFIPGRVASVFVNKQEIGYIGEVNPEVLKNFELDVPVSCFELNISILYKLMKK